MGVLFRPFVILILLFIISKVKHELSYSDFFLHLSLVATCYQSSGASHPRSHIQIDLTLLLLISVGY